MNERPRRSGAVALKPLLFKLTGYFLHPQPDMVAVGQRPQQNQQLQYHPQADIVSAIQADLEAAGIKNFISVKSNVLDTLKYYLKELGI